MRIGPPANVSACDLDKFTKSLLKTLKLGNLQRAGRSCQSERFPRKLSVDLESHVLSVSRFS